MSADMTEVEIVDDDDSKAVRSESTASAEGCEDGAAIAGEDTTDGDSVATPQARVPSAPGITATKGSPDVSKLKATPLAAAGKLNNFRPAGNGG